MQLQPPESRNDIFDGIGKGNVIFSMVLVGEMFFPTIGLASRCLEQQG